VHVVADGEVGRAGRLDGQAGVAGDAGSRPDGELQAALQVEERDGAVLELLADDAVGRQSEAVPVEPERPLQIVDAQGEHGDPRLQRAASSPLKFAATARVGLERNGHTDSWTSR